ncbi:molybdopterin-dependent oxidoreductase [Desertifilum sp. FACHB-1129]|nr:MULTISPECIES: molybdopterin-dependent oxidoreductase [Desertifilum]MBD2315138.1 molybdopterin-dependent oxidoreductase [Desertifilum sp. FACHB-1129]MBD2323750.1 molybdopterin-dependent oxidoreductase [Desertifilum sp. FACHB-866]MBD2333595.1 molybdopterin-dependent oxidoreductase [Desertifilum sp. FACHB-868]MDA0213567.1 molybdopterin-dependent oxidoreductase [Cyanobacteria bacterium FC1]
MMTARFVKLFRSGSLFLWLSLGLGVVSCTPSPSSTQLDVWYQEAIAADRTLLQQQTQLIQQQQWVLEISGQTRSGESVQLNWAELAPLATTVVQTRSPHHLSNPEEILQFRGIRVSELLARIGTAANATKITFVAYDGYRATVDIADLRRYPVTLALEMNGMPISRSEGGPLFLVFPYHDFPELESPYPDPFWVFYVTNIIVGTEPIELQVGETTLTQTDLQSLEPISIEETVSYRMGWPSTPVKLQGYRLRDILQWANLPLPENGKVIIEAKPPIYQGSENPLRFNLSDIQNCDIFLATSWGPSAEPIPTRLGGPVTLAIPSSCNRQTQTFPEELRWITFVQSVRVQGE